MMYAVYILYPFRFIIIAVTCNQGICVTLMMWDDRAMLFNNDLQLSHYTKNSLESITHGSILSHCLPETW